MSKEKKMVVIHEGNNEKKPVEVQLNHFQGAQCGMTIRHKEHTVQAISQNGKTWFFDDPGCFALWFKEFKNKDDLTIFAYSNDTKKYIDAKKAWYNKTEETTMGYGFGTYENKKANMITFDEMLVKMYQGEHLANPDVRKKLLGE